MKSKWEVVFHRRNGMIVRVYIIFRSWKTGMRPPCWGLQVDENRVTNGVVIGDPDELIS